MLKPSGRFLCLEFSHVTMPALDKLYDSWSFHVIPKLKASSLRAMATLTTIWSRAYANFPNQTLLPPSWKLQALPVSAMTASARALRSCIVAGKFRDRRKQADASIYQILRFARLLLAQNSLLPPDFHQKAPFWVRFGRGVLTFGAPNFDHQEKSQRGQALSQRLQTLGPTYIKLGQSLAATRYYRTGAGARFTLSARPITALSQCAG